MVPFISNSECNYKFDYSLLFSDIEAGRLDPLATYRSLVLNDLFFIVYFVIGIPIANHPFVVDSCKRVEKEVSFLPTLELWARGHFKTTIATARTIQRILKDPEATHAKFSHTRPIAKGMLRAIKFLFENSDLLKACFPDILYQNPQGEAPKWSEDDGIIVKRKSSKRESTVEAWGLIEGMPTSKHFDFIDYDDIETADVVENPEMIEKLKGKYDVSLNLVTKGGSHTTWGTFYSHAGCLTYVRDKENIHGKRIYKVNLIPATVDGTPTGKPVFLSQEEIDNLRSDEYTFNCQQLLNPTPVGVRKFNSSDLIVVHEDTIPGDVIKFLIVDAAGDNKGEKKGDRWAAFVLGVSPNLDNLGLSDVYLLDGILSPLGEEEAPLLIADMWVRNLPIEHIGVEKVGLSTTEIHIQNALAIRGFYVTQSNQGIKILKPGGREKKQRIARALILPFKKGKIHVSSRVDPKVIQIIGQEMDMFPYWNDDGLDVLAYLYDLITDQSICWIPDEDEQEEPSQVGRNLITGY